MKHVTLFSILFFVLWAMPPIVCANYGDPTPFPERYLPGPTPVPNFSYGLQSVPDNATVYATEGSVGTFSFWVGIDKDRHEIKPDSDWKLCCIGMDSSAIPSHIFQPTAPITAGSYTVTGNWTDDETTFKHGGGTTSGGDDGSVTRSATLKVFKVDIDAIETPIASGETDTASASVTPGATGGSDFYYWTRSVAVCGDPAFVFIDENEEEQICWISESSSDATIKGVEGMGSGTIDNEIVNVFYTTDQDTLGNTTTACASEAFTVVWAQCTIYVNQPGSGGDDDVFEGSLPNIDTGHAWWGFSVAPMDLVDEDLQGYATPCGYYPDPGYSVLPILGFESCPGTLRVGDGQEIESSKSYPLSFSDVVAGLTFTKSCHESPGEYNVFLNNCADQVVQAGSSAGINVPDPQGLFGIPPTYGSNPGMLGEALREE